MGSMSEMVCQGWNGETWLEWVRWFVIDNLGEMVCLGSMKAVFCWYG